TDTQLNPFLQDLGVGYKQIVTNQLDLVAQLLAQNAPAVPIVFGHAVFDGDDGVLVAPVGQQIGKVLRAQGHAAFAGQVVFAVAVELGSGAVQGQSDLGAGFVASLFDSAQDQFDSGFVVGHVRSKTTLIAHSGGHALIVDQAFQGVEYFCTHAQRFAEALGTHGHDHEF